LWVFSDIVGSTGEQYLMAALRDKVFEEEYAYIAVGGQENSFLKINLY
jgi:hypothetical protein